MGFFVALRLFIVYNNVMKRRVETIKKLISFIVLLSLVFSLGACGTATKKADLPAEWSDVDTSEFVTLTYLIPGDKL